MGVLDENMGPKEKSDDRANGTILDISDSVIYFGTPTSAEKRLHAMETPPQHVSSRRKTVLLPSKTVLFSVESLNQQENSKEKKKNRRQSYLYATKSSVMLEKQRSIEIQDDEDVTLYSRNPFEENTLFIEAPGSVERKIKKRKSDVERLFPLLSSFQKRRKEIRRFSIVGTIAHRSTSTVSRRKSASLLQKQNKTLECALKKEIDHVQTHASFYIRIQAYIRGYLIRKSITLQNRAAKVIQLRYLTMLARRDFYKQRKSAIIIQAAWRGWVIRMRYLEIVEACISIQKWWRQLSQRKKTRKKDVCINFQEKETIRDISNNSSLQGFLKKWESKKALATSIKDRNMKKDSFPDRFSSELEADVKGNHSFHLIDELSSQKMSIPIISDESQKLSKKILKPKTLLSESKSTSSMTMMLKQSISLSTARILSNSTKSLPTSTHNYHMSFKSLPRLQKSRLLVPTFTSRTTVLNDISPNSLKEDTNETLCTPTKNIKIDGISTGALRVPTPSPKKGACLGSPRKTIKKAAISRKTALLASQNIKLLHSSQVVSENTPKKNTSSFANNGLGSPSRQKVINQTEFFTFKNLESNNEERGLYNRSRIESKTLFTPILQPHVPTTKHNAVSQNSYTPYRSLNYLTLGEITKMTRQNTYQNRIYRCDFDRVIVRKNQMRPPSPTAKSQSKLAAEARLRRKKLQKEKTHDYTLGPGDDDNWTPRELTPLKKGVKWDKLLESDFGQSKSNHTLEKSNLKKIKFQKGCLSKKTQMIRLDDLGNVLDAREPLTPIIGKAEKVIVQKFLYKGEEDE
ncbi:hypothetical protein PMAC_000366 [Pneumocystis sp. 'macacae']|nr:hypothetical protein PMAC_000366 [Pneumocystis sp. 'macacae']